MNVNLTSKMATATVAVWALAGMLSQTARADVFWNGSVSGDWSVAGNWTGGLPSAAGAGNAVINPGSPFATPVVSTAGNTTVGQTYVSIGAGLNVVPGGQLTTSDLITGIWGNSSPVSVTGGLLTMTGILNMGAGGFDGDVNISGGTVTAGILSINNTGGAGIDISGSGSFVAPISNLGNINFWVGNGDITANGGAPGWTVNVDTLSQAGDVVLTAVLVPEPSTFALAGLGLGVLVLLRRRHC